MENAMKAFCIGQMEKLIAAKSQEPCLAEVSKEEIEEALLKIAGNIVRSKGVISGAVKNVLFNLDNFRPEVRSEFESGIFELWHEAYKKLNPEKIEPAISDPSREAQLAPESETATHPEPEAAAEPMLEQETEPEPELGPEIPTAAEPEPKLDPEIPPVAEPESGQKTSSSVHIEPEMQPNAEPEFKRESGVKEVEKSRIRGSSSDDEEAKGALLQKRRRDWFDLLLDASAVLTRPFSRKNTDS